MKKKAFTVAEILITLGIIGVVAALTLPMVTQNTQKKVYANALSTAVSDLENATTTMLIKEGAYTLHNTPAWKEDFMGNLKKSFPYSTDDVGSLDRLTLQKTEGEKFTGTYKFFSNNGVLYGVTLQDESDELKENEVMMAGGEMTSIAADIYIDINGPKKPNMWGRDTFRYVLGADGHMYPYGGKAWSIYNKMDYGSTTAKDECVVNQKGEYCAAYLAENGYEMDY